MARIARVGYVSAMSASPLRRALARDPSFRPADQAAIALFVAQLDDQTRRLKAGVEGRTPADLEWQPRPGRNSAGMLLAHNAVTEVFWIGVASGRTPDRESADRHCREVLGIATSDDGMPAEADGRHPAALAGWELPRYVDLLDRARRHLKTEAAAWRDADLGAFLPYEATFTESREFGREWILYHLLEHYAQHAGQVGLVLALRRAAGA
jgi:uncharacterized damage-inducible protein DinB